MFQTFWRTVVGGAQITEDTAYEVYTALVAVGLVLCGMILGMGLLNAFIAKEVNYFFFFIGGILILMKGFKPPVVGASAIGGVGLHFLADKDLSQGAIKGLEVLYKVVTGVLFGFWVIAGLLATWSFKEAPGAILPIVAMGLTIGVTIELFNMKGGVFKWVVIIYAVGVICTAFWQTFPADWKAQFKATPPPAAGALGSKTAAGATPDVIPEDYVLVAGGTLVVQKKLRCYGNNMSNEQLKGVSIVWRGKDLIFTSKLADPLQFRIWFFDEGGDCKTDLAVLNAQKKFI
jgi:hypothetical protein